MSATAMPPDAGFRQRHIGSSAGDQAEMLHVLGFSSCDALIDAVVPSSIRAQSGLALPEPLDEVAALERLRGIAAKNRPLTSFIGQGYYGTITPPVILRNVLENPAWYTAYTPYQPEISQGRLEALINFQTMVCDLTGMAIANASMLDEGTAAAEAMALALRVGKSRSRTMFVADDVFAQTLDVVRTRASTIGIDVVTGAPETAADAEPFAAVFQYPGSDGEIRDLRAATKAVQDRGGLVIVAADILALTLLAPPGEWGADVVVGSTQRFGVPMGYGGPHAGYLATRDEFKRSLPGRLVGVTVDVAGDPAFRLALQTREQHIRREKATSNICTAQVLLAVIAAMYAVYHGPEGLTSIARRVHGRAVAAKRGLEALGFRIPVKAYFDTFTVATGEHTQRIADRAVALGANLRRVDAATLGVTVDETTREADVERLLRAFGEAEATSSSGTSTERLEVALPESLIRTSTFLTHPVFQAHRSETVMLRYLRRLSDKDLALDRAMIPLGSCTMKLNATSEMLPLTWQEFSGMHPFAPEDQAVGYIELVRDLERMLCACTGYDAVSLQPNAGSQGEFAGLLAIEAYHRSRGEAHRDVCLIPSSAHGTNPASAQMVGMRVVVVACDDEGNVDLADLEAKAQAHRDTLAAIMVTYPSTHGVFESGIRRICEIVHACGGQVYVDGANLNALVGIAWSGAFGADVSHLNLHKTFCIPHGGGGPGVGPVAVKAHLAPFLPQHRFMPRSESPSRTPRASDGVGAVASAPFGSASILPIPWMYITMMGASGLTAATQAAILHANYIAKCLSPHYPVLYSGPGGLVAHECILDLRPLKATAGIEAEDVAKRLIDYGFHAPTMSFPVAGTLMVEPTESESKAEIDRFIEAMIAIREEIRAIESGAADRTDNTLKNAPHTAQAVSADDWSHGYSRRVAAYPSVAQEGSKYWPPVARIDNVYGDRNLFCTCIPVDAYGEAAPAVPA